MESSQPVGLCCVTQGARPGALWQPIGGGDGGDGGDGDGGGDGGDGGDGVGDDGDGGGDGDDLGNIGGVMILTDLASIQDLELSHLLPFYFCCISISFSLSN